MIRYFLAAQGLKAFSMTPGTRRAYRAIGNRIGGRKRAARINPSYIRRASENLAWLEQALDIAPGMTILELGTGWVHWESLFTRLFHPVRIVAMDVWDNRQFDGFRRYCEDLATRLDTEVPRPEGERQAARALLQRIARCPDFETVYRELGMRYVVEPSGRLNFQETGSVDAIISSDVLEHVPAEAFQTLVEDMFRVLKPGGVSSHQVVPADHLCIYDRSAHPKNYLRYSNRTWRAFFQNEVQYVNRLQASQIRAMFERAGFEDIRLEVTERAPLGDLPLAAEFAGLDRDDLECAVFRMAARKPRAA